MSETSAVPTFRSGTLGRSTRHGQADPCDVVEPLACRYCGRSTPADGATYRTYPSEPWRWFGPGRICSACEAEITAHGELGEREALVVALVGHVPANLDELAPRVRFYEELGVIPPDVTSPHDDGTLERWEHVDAPALVADAEAAAVAVEVASSWRAHDSGMGCGGCGARFSTGWPRATRAVSGETVPVCADCAALMPESMNEIRYRQAFADRLAARAAGLIGPPFAGWAERMSFPIYVTSHPGGEGTAMPFEWMGDDLDRLRAYAALNWAEAVADPERRAEAVRAAADAQGHGTAVPSSGLRL